MSLEQQIMADLKTAMLAKNETAMRSLRAIKAAILNAKTAEGASGELNETDEIKILQKQVKQRKDSLEIFEKQNRPDLALKETEENAIIEKYLPKQMSEDEVKAELSNIIKEIGAASPADFGKLMGAATKKLGGKVDGKTISTLARQLLNS